MLARNTKTALLPKYERVKSFYNKAQLEQIEISGGDKVYFLYSEHNDQYLLCLIN